MSEETNTLPKDIAAAEGKVNVQINGTWHSFPRGMRIIDACQSVGVFVPRFCYHTKLKVSGSCRMCLVEQGMPPRPAPGQAPAYGKDGYQAIQWMPRPIIACANTVCENMGIRTNSTLANEVRRGVLELYLTSHPLDCPICDQAGECKLQEYSSDFGQASSRFTDSKTKKGKNLSVGPRINLDQERCVLCGRCVRFMRDVMGDEVLSMSQRGTHNAITIFPGRELDSNYSMNTVDLCPVGALTSKDFRFQMRVWFLKETKTISIDSGTGINITLWTREDKAFRITPRQNDDVNSCWMPDSERLNYKYINSDQRIPQPVVRTDAGAPHRAATWEPAITSVAEAVKRVPAGQLAIIASGRMTNEELFLAGQLAKLTGAAQFDIIARTGESDGTLISADRNPNTTGIIQILGIQNPGSSIASIRDAVRNGSIKALIVLGEDLTTEAKFTAADLGKLDYLATLCHSASETAKASDVVLPGVTFAEKSGTMINVAGRIQRLNRAIMPLGDARDDWQILRDLGIALGGDKETLGKYTSSQDILATIAQNIPTFSGITWGNIGDLGKQLVETGITIPLIEREKSGKAN